MAENNTKLIESWRSFASSQGFRLDPEKMSIIGAMDNYSLAHEANLR